MPLRFRGFELDEDRRELRRDGRDVPLQPRVFDLLVYLVRNRDRVVPKEELLEAVWPDVFVADGSLQRAISTVRSALGDDGGDPLIRTYARRGYRFNHEAVHEAPSETATATVSPAVAEARTAYALGSWETAAHAYQRGDADGEDLDGDDLERWAIAADWAGRGDEAVAPLERAVSLRSSRGDNAGAARAALLLTQICFERREMALARGWHRRAARFLRDVESPSYEHGLFAFHEARLHLFLGDFQATMRSAEIARSIGEQLDSCDIEALGLLYLGHALLSMGDVENGAATHDEAAAAVLAGQLGSYAAGIVYCGVIWACLNRSDYDRASQWTDRFTDWSRENGIAGFPGLCRLHRAEIFSLRGDLVAAEAEAEGVCELLGRSAPWAEGDAYRVLGEIRLARGELDQAESAFRHSIELGWDPQPALARLLVARGEPHAALQSLRDSLASNTWTARERRVSLLAELVTISTSIGDRETAQEAMDELDAVPPSVRSPALNALVEQARAELLHASGDTPAAIAALRESMRGWQQARSQLALANARLRLVEFLFGCGEPGAAERELLAAEAVINEAPPGLLARRLEALRRRL